MDTGDAGGLAFPGRFCRRSRDVPSDALRAWLPGHSGLDNLFLQRIYSVPSEILYFSSYPASPSTGYVVVVFVALRQESHTNEEVLAPEGEAPAWLECPPVARILRRIIL